MLESLFNKIAQLEKSATLSKRDSSMGVFLWNLWIFQEQLFLKKTSLVAASEIKKVFNFQHFSMINLLFETCGFTNNPNFILFKWRLKRKYSPAKCVICPTEIHWMEIHLNIESMFIFLFIRFWHNWLFNL